MTQADSLGRASGLMALGTLASRLTGFLRVMAVTAAIGLQAVSNGYNVANTAPNILYELLLGGVLTSIVVPLLIQAARDDGDEGVGFAQLLLTLVVVVLGVAAIVGILAAPLIVRLFNVQAGAQRELTTTFLRYFLPQIVFYGVGATITAILNTRGRFGAPMFAPVLNNLVVIATAAIFILLPGPRPPEPATMTGTQVAVLAIGTTLGVVIMTLALLPSLRASGFRWRWRLGRHPALRRAVRLAAWVLCYVAVNQIGYAVIVRLANAADPLRGVTAYQYGFLLFQLPHAVVTVSIVTALLPRLSEHAVADRLAQVRTDLAHGLQLVAAVLLPAAVGYVVLARPLAVLVFAHGAAAGPDARFVGTVLTAFACGLASFSAFQLFLRTFYALQDSKTPALVNLATNLVNIAADLVLFAVLDGRDRVVGLAVGHAVSYTVGAAIFARLLRNRLGGLHGYQVTRTVVRVLIASAIGAGGAYGVASALLAVVGRGPGGSLLAVVGAGLVGGCLYVVAARRMQVSEVTAVSSLVRRALGR